MFQHHAPHTTCNTGIYEYTTVVEIYDVLGTASSDRQRVDTGGVQCFLNSRDTP